MGDAYVRLWTQPGHNCSGNDFSSLMRQPLAQPMLFNCQLDSKPKLSEIWIRLLQNFQQNDFRIVACKMVAILFGPQYVSCFRLP